jgi:hypothetical protein
MTRQKIWSLIGLFVFLAGCRQASQSETGGLSPLRECVGGIQARLSFSGSAFGSVSERVVAHYRWKSHPAGAQMAETVNECESQAPIFPRSTNEISVSFVGFGWYSPAVYDLQVTDCASGAELLHVINVQPASDSAGKLCEIFEVTYQSQ